LRFRRLGLAAFGPFTGHELDLSGGAPGGLHVIHGENEAGKSTALRAVAGLLYGIPERTEDAHLHPGSELRIDACLEAESGETLEVVRRKKRRDSLRDALDTPIDESVLTRLFNLLDADSFANLFGLDHKRLKLGGERLLEGGGDIGESLFEAGVGGRGVHAVLVELREQAERLFKPRASTSRINVGVQGYKEAMKRKRESDLDAGVWNAQAAALDEARRAQSELALRLRELRAEQHRLKRVQGFFGLVAHRREKLERRAAIGAVPALPADAQKRRSQAERALWEATPDVERLAIEVAERERRLAALDAPDKLLLLGDAGARSVTEQLGAERKAAHDLPGIQTAIRLGEDDARAILRRIGKNVPLEQVETLRLGAAEQKRIRELARERERLAERLEAQARKLRDRERDLADRRSALSRLGEAQNATELAGPLARARRAGDMESRRRQVEEECTSLAAALCRKRAQLVPPLPESAAASDAGVPTPETIERFALEYERLAQQRLLLEERRREREEKLADATRQIDEIHAAGDVPSEEQLEAMRARRGRGWALVRRRYVEGVAVDDEARCFDAERGLPEAFEQALLAADEVADRLRREATRVLELGKLKAAAQAERGALGRVVAEQRVLDGERSSLDGAWHSAFSGLGIAPLSPAEMRGWRRRHEELVTLAERRAEAEHTRDGLKAEHAELDKELRQVLRGHELLPAAAELAVLADLAEAERQRRSDVARERAQLREAIAQLELHVREDRVELEEQRVALADWIGRFGRATASLGLEQPTPEEALVVLDQLTSLFARLDELADRRRRADGIRRDERAFAGEIARLVALHAPELGSLGPRDAAEQLVELYRKACHQASERTRLEGELVEDRAAQAAALAKAAHARAELDELMRLAGVSDAAALERAERHASTARDLEREIGELENELRKAGGGSTLDEILEESAAADRSSVVQRLDELDRELEEADEALRSKIGDVTKLELGLGRYASGQEAAEAMQEAALLDADVEQQVERFVRLRVAATVLEREIERYRERNQGPVLARASELFPRLTLGRYRSLRAGLEDRVLYSVRQDGAEVEVGGLSEGAQYQLYLALRLATLERYLDHNPAMPLVLDDVLIHFDDQRARAAFEVLAELATRVQILCFTHLERDLELCREVVPHGLLFEHRLAPPAFVTARRGSARSSQLRRG
jgi:uncharacterized protein YhaN